MPSTQQKVGEPESLTSLKFADFIPGTNLQINWSANSLGLLKTCPRKYQLSKIEGWVPKDQSMHLRFGIMVTDALERYDRAVAKGTIHEEALENTTALALAESAGWETGDSKKNRDTLIRTIVWYLETYKDDPAKTLILASGEPAVELAFKFEIDHKPSGFDGPYLLNGRLDKLVTIGDDPYVLDHKTTGSTIGSYYFDRYDPDNQMSLYTFASQVVYSMPFKGVLIDAIQTAVGFTAFGRGLVHRSTGQLEEWLQDTKTWLDIAQVYAERNHWPMNEASCNNYGRCQFAGICNKDPAVREIFLSTDFERRAA